MYCYATGAVSSFSSGSKLSYSGGLVGHNSKDRGKIGFISDSYAIGNVSSTSTSYSSGGLVGLNEGSIVNCYYNFETSGQYDDDGRGEPKSTVQMKLQATFAGWSFNKKNNIWGINANKNNGYPYLQLRESITKSTTGKTK